MKAFLMEEFKLDKNSDELKDTNQVVRAEDVYKIFERIMFLEFALDFYKMIHQYFKCP